MTRSWRYQVPVAVVSEVSVDLRVVPVMFCDDLRPAQRHGQPGHDGLAPIQAGLGILVGRSGVLGQQQPQLVELLEVEGAEVGVLQPADGLELRGDVHRAPLSSERPVTAGARVAGHPPLRPSSRAARHHPRVPERQRIAAYGVCVDPQGRLLLARAAPALSLRGRWFLPGGGVDHGETPDHRAPP